MSTRKALTKTDRPHPAEPTSAVPSDATERPTGGGSATQREAMTTLTVRIPEGLKRRAKLHALTNDTTVGAMITASLSGYLDEQDGVV